MKIVFRIMFGVSVASFYSGVLNGMLLNHVSKTCDRIYCIGEVSGNLEEMCKYVDDANKKLAELIAKGANIDECNEAGVTPLMGAAREGLVLFIDTLLKAGANADTVDKNGFTALDYAIAYSIPPAQENIFAFIPWIITAGLCLPGRRQCVEFLMCHLHLDKTAVEARIAGMIHQLRKGESVEQKEELYNELSQSLLGEVQQ